MMLLLKHIKDSIEYTKATLIENKDMVDYFEYSFRGGEVRMPFNDILYIETTGSSHKLRIVGKNFLKNFMVRLQIFRKKTRKHSASFHLINLI